MKKVNIIAVGKIKENFFADGIKEYVKRLGKFCEFNIIEIPDKGGVNKECEGILQKINGYKILLDIKGKLLKSEDIAELIKDKHLTNDIISFIIGGSDGVNESVKNAADSILSFGAITYPHQMMRLILTEQIYRAFTIVNNLPYHK